MSQLEAISPSDSWFDRVPLSRDQVVLLLVAVNELFLGLDTYLVHGANGTIRFNEQIPIYFGVISGIILLIAGILAARNRQTATILATLIFIASGIVGVLGAYFHITRGINPTAPAGQQVTVGLLVWAPPIIAPLMFGFAGFMGMSAVWREDPAESGRLRLWRNRYLQLPYSKTHAYFFMVSIGTLIAAVSSILDHARTPWDSIWLWIPVVVPVFAILAAAAMGATRQPSRADVATYIVAMVLLIVVGLIGAWLHIETDLTSNNVIVFERFLRGAPFLAPLLFANLGFIGLVVLLDSAEMRPSRA